MSRNIALIVLIGMLCGCVGAKVEVDEDLTDAIKRLSELDPLAVNRLYNDYRAEAQKVKRLEMALDNLRSIRYGPIGIRLVPGDQFVLDVVSDSGSRSVPEVKIDFGAGEKPYSYRPQPTERIPVILNRYYNKEGVYKVTIAVKSGDGDLWDLQIQRYFIRKRQDADGRWHETREDLPRFDLSTNTGVRECEFYVIIQEAPKEAVPSASP